MSTAREVVAQALADLINDEITEGDRRQADAVLAALREHWTSDEVLDRIYERCDSPVAVIAALFEEAP